MERRLHSLQRYFFVTLFTMASVLGWGQTNPVAQSLPYSQNFASLTGSSPVYPAGWQGWNVTGTIGTSYVTTAPNANQAISVQTNATAPGALIGDFIGKMGVMSTGNATTGQKTICLSVNTTGNSSIVVAYDAATQRTENTRQNALGLQYRIGTSGTFTNVSSSEYQNQMTPTNTTGTGAVKIQNISVTLPSTCDNQAEVQLRWVIRDVSGSGNRPGFSIDNISVTGTPDCSTVAPVGTITATNNCGSTDLSYSGADASTCYWQTTSGGTSTSLPATSTYNVTTSGTYYVNSYNGTCWSSSPKSQAVTILASPNITASPSTSTQTICTGGTLTALSVTASGSGLTYQWYSNTSNSNSGGNLISSATSSSYTPSNSVASSLYYYCIVTGSCGATVTSNPSGLITVNITPTITGTTSVCIGSTTQLTGSGTPNASNPWVSSNTTVATVDGTGLVTGVTAGTTTITYKNSNGCTTTTTVTVNASTAITTQPTAQSTTAGNTATFTVVATGAGLTYQWQVSIDCGATWTNVSTGTGGTTASYTTAATTSADNQNRYRVIVSGSCGNVTSDGVVLSVVISSSCLSTSFTATDTTSSGGYYTGTYTIVSKTWNLNNVLVDASTNARLQINQAAGSWVELPPLDNPSSISIYSKLSGSGSETLAAEYYNTTTLSWVSIDTKSITSTYSTVPFDISSISNLTGVRVRLNKTTNANLRSLYIDDLTVNCTTPKDYTWIGGANTTLWTDACNWSPKGVPTSVDNVIFNTSPAYLLNITDSRTVNNFTLNGTGNFNMSATGVLTINGNVTYGDTATATLDCASKVNIASTNSQTIPPLNYGNLDTTGGARVLLSNKTVGICNVFTPGNGTYTVNQSTINYNGTSNQSISNKFTYYNLTLSGSGTKTPSGAISVDTNGTVKITGTAIANFTNYNLASTSANTTAFTMDGGRLILGTTGTQPNMRGAYNLTGGVVEFANTNASAQTIRTASYQNIEVTGSNVGNSSGNITLNSAGTFTVKSGGIFSINDNSITCPSGNGSITVENNGVFKTGNNKGFNGFVATLSDNSAIHANITNITLTDGSTVEYTKAANQTITEFKPLPASPTTADYTNANYGYYNLKISGDNTTAPVSAKTVTGTGVYVRNNLDVVTPAILKIDANKAITVYNNITSAGENNFIIENNGNLIQVNDANTNLGSITVKRNANLKRLDYNYWGSPVAGQNLKTFSPGTLNSRFYTYSETDDLFYWIDPFANSFQKGIGYAIRASNTAPSSTAVFNGTFLGQPNNGAFTVPIAYSGVDHGFNLISNPYPSNINFDDLYNANSGLIYQTAYFWTNVNANPEMQGNQYPKTGSINNYAVYSGLGGVAAPYGFDPSRPASTTPNSIIKVGQGFIVKAQTSGNLSFSNTMRGHDNSGSFFNKMSSINQKDRIWLELKTPLNFVNPILIGYARGASNGFEQNFDAPLLVEGADSFYSILDNQKLVIQGREYPVTDDDVIPLGATFYETGIHTISISKKDGVFGTGKAIYLHDKLLGSYTDLQLGDYTFSATQGESVNRFEIVYKTSGILSTDNTVKYGLRVYQSGEHFIVEADKIFTEVKVYDASGRLLNTIKSGKKQLMIEKNKLVGGFNLFSIIFADDIVNKKVISK